MTEPYDDDLLDQEAAEEAYEEEYDEDAEYEDYDEPQVGDSIPISTEVSCRFIGQVFAILNLWLYTE
jgi:hypothetical protein